MSGQGPSLGLRYSAAGTALTSERTVLDNYRIIIYIWNGFNYHSSSLGPVEGACFKVGVIRLERKFGKGNGIDSPKKPMM